MNNSTSESLTPMALAAYDHVDAVIPEADGHVGIAPWWHGWAVREAFEAGAKWQRTQPEIDPQWAKMAPSSVINFLEQESRFDAALIESMLKFAIHAAQQSK